MPVRRSPLLPGYYYHLFNRGANKQKIFKNQSDYIHLLETFYYYQFSGPKPSFSTHRRFKIKDFSRNPKIVQVIAYCLMPNHFHLLVKQLTDDGISEFMRKSLNSFTRYFNIRNGCLDSLFGSRFNAIVVEGDEQLMHLSRHIHLNPLVAGITTDLNTYPYSSFPNYVGLAKDILCDCQPIMSLFSSTESYKNFVTDQVDYALELDQIKHLIHDPE